MMKITRNLLILLSSLLFTIPTLIDGSHLPYLRRLGGGDDSSTTMINNGTSVSVSSSICNTVQNQEDCIQMIDTDTGHPCIWCVASAIPSECVSAEQAALLPPLVFDCSIPGGSSLSSSSNVRTEPKRKTSFTFDSPIFGTTQTYSLVQSSFSSSKNHTSSGTTTYHHEHEHEQPPIPSKSDLCDDSSNSVSGYMDITGSEYDKSNENKHLFYWFFEQRGNNISSTTPFVVWLTGGPGCSSTLALLTENGPCTVNKDGATTKINPYSWTESAHVLWLDQPAGVGFSYGQETDTNEQMISEDAYYFLQAFFQTYTQYQTNPLYIVGESYGGHYAPAIAHRIWVGNSNLKPTTIHLNLSGLGIGNGLTDPAHQYPAYVDMVTNNSHGIKIVDDATADAMRDIVPKCVALINQCNAGDSLIDTFACQSAFLLCNSGLTSPYQLTGLNPYDIRIQCEHRPLCYDFSHIQTWLNLESTMQALNVDEKHSHAWTSCNFGINMQFHTDWMKDFSGYVADLLNDGIPALIYAGDVDFICNYIGNRAWTLALSWDYASEFQNAMEHDWKGQGLARTAHGLTFLQVYDAGHMVPSDKPEVALDMITNFLNGGTF